MPPLFESIESQALEALGWSPFFQSQLPGLDESLTPARVVLASRGRIQLLSEAGPLLAVTAGRLAHLTLDDSDLPAVGDWVLVRVHDGEGPHQVVHVLARRTCFARKAAGKRTERQVVAANVDRVFVVSSVGPDLNPRRIERYLTAAAESGAAAALVISKADLTDDPGAFERAARAVAGDTPLFLVSAKSGEGIATLRAALSPGETVALLGSSGVGKSALANRLLGRDALAVGAIREHDGRGQHTTTHRELVVLPGGALLVDTPGMRELGLWGTEEGPGAFAEIEALAEGCRFRDCTHQTEPGCLVLEAVARGDVPPERMQSYEKLGRELARLQRSQEGHALHEERRRRARFTKSVRARPKR